MNRTGLRFRTPADVRAIPNQEWERWLRDEAVPWSAFSATRDVQITLRYLVNATLSRLGLPGRIAPPKLTDRQVERSLQVAAYRLARVSEGKTLH